MNFCRKLYGRFTRETGKLKFFCAMKCDRKNIGIEIILKKIKNLTSG
jgi:hypothetical protein